MKSNNERTLTPKLRFPEFRGKNGWTEKELADLCERIMDGTHFSPKSKAGVMPYLTSKNIKDGIIDLSDLSYISNEEHAEIYKRCPVKKNDVLLTKDGANTGNCALNTLEGEFSLLSSVAVLRGDKTKISQEFLFQSIHSPQIRKVIEDSMSGQAITRITLDKLGKYVIPIPCTAEQQKIADCLTSLDELIAAQGRKVEALKAHKKGLMQQLFPREGETLPRLRFPEFRKNADWDSRPIGELGDVLMCRRILANQTNPMTGIPFYKIGTLGGIPDAYITKNVYDDYRDRFSFPRKGEILITCAGTVGKCVPYDGNDAYYQDSNIVWIDNPKEEVSNLFLFFLLSAVDWDKLNSTTITRIYLDDLRTLQVKFPRYKAEQQRIADCLSELDLRIAAEAKKLVSLKSHKQGLMQQLFPSPEGS